MKTKKILIFLLTLLVFFEYWDYFRLNSDEPFIPTQLREQKSEAYWLESGFQRKHFDRLLNSQICEQDEQSQLACQMALEKMKFHCGLKNKLSPQAFGIEREEVKELKPFVALTADDFSKQVDHTMSLCPQAQRPFVLSQGVNSFLSIYRDPHSYIMPYNYFLNVVAAKEQKGLRFGFSIRRDQSLKWRIARVDQPLEKNNTKLQVGDEVLEVQGIPLSKVNSRWIQEQLQQSNPIKVKLAKQGREVNLQFSPKPLDTPNVSSYWVSESRHIALIRVDRFARSTCHDFKAQLTDLKAQDLRGLILDLRDNPGGSVDEAACLMDLLVPKKQLLFITFDQLKEQAQTYLSKRAPIYNGPLAVMVNAGSASASEIVAGGLQALNRAKVAGQRTFGKGTYQDGEVWSELDSIIIFETKGYYVFSNQKTAQLNGIKPDIEIPQSINWMREQDLYLYPVSAEFIDSKQQISKITQRFKISEPKPFSMGSLMIDEEAECLEDTQIYEDNIQIALKAFSCESQRYGRP